MNPRPDIAIALLCAREDVASDPDGTPVPHRVVRLREHCAAFDDWAALVALVDRLLVLPLVHRHLRAHAADLVPAAVMDALAARARHTVLRNLQVADVHLRLIRDVLAPAGAPHLFVKGTTLAHRFYTEPGLRVARDVDVLVPRAALEDMGRRLRELGWTAKHAPFSADDGIRYSARVLGELEWYSPDGVLVEVHSKIQLGEGRLPTDRLLADPADVVVAGVPVPALQEVDAIAHLCLHHSRSGWDRLHQVADLDAVLRSTGADPRRLIAEARACGFGRVVAASLELHRALSGTDPCTPSGRPHVRTGSERVRPADLLLGTELTRLCLAGLGRFDPTGVDRRRPRAERRRAVRVAIADLGLLRRSRVHARQRLGMFARQGADFIRLPLPARWHLAYLVLRPFLRVIRGPFGSVAA